LLAVRLKGLLGMAQQAAVAARVRLDKRLVVLETAVMVAMVLNGPLVPEPIMGVEVVAALH
jgi:hypothetical protein